MHLEEALQFCTHDASLSFMSRREPVSHSGALRLSSRTYQRELLFNCMVLLLEAGRVSVSSHGTMTRQMLQPSVNQQSGAIATDTIAFVTCPFPAT